MPPLTVYRIAANTVLREVGVHVINELSVPCVIVVLSALGLSESGYPTPSPPVKQVHR